MSVVEIESKALNANVFLENGNSLKWSETRINESLQ